MEEFGLSSFFIANYHLFAQHVFLTSIMCLPHVPCSLKVHLDLDVELQYSHFDYHYINITSFKLLTFIDITIHRSKRGFRGTLESSLTACSICNYPDIQSSYLA